MSMLSIPSIKVIAFRFDFILVFSLHFTNTSISFSDNKFQSNLNEIDKFEHKSSLDGLNKGFGWPTDHVGINLGKFNKNTTKIEKKTHFHELYL